LSKKTGVLFAKKAENVGIKKKLLTEEITTKWLTPVSKLQIWVDFPTLYNKIHLFDEHNHEIELEVENKGAPIPTMRKLLENLAFHLGDYREVDDIKHRFLFDIKDTQGLDLSNQVEEFFLKYINEESKTVKLLKAINHVVLAPPYIALKNRFLASELPIKDVPGSWKVMVYFGQKDITVRHSKKAKAAVPADGNFEFTWNLIITINRGVTLLKDVSLELDRCTAHSEMLEEKKKELKKILKEINPNRKDDLIISTRMLVLSPEEAENFKKAQLEKYEQQLRENK
jgi:hypothetical protein